MVGFLSELQTIMEYFEYFTPLAMILICWLYAKNILMEEKIKNLVIASRIWRIGIVQYSSSSFLNEAFLALF